eukprot:3258980-Amphidinium_carterae.1
MTHSTAVPASPSLCYNAVYSLRQPGPQPTFCCFCELVGKRPLNTYHEALRGVKGASGFKGGLPPILKEHFKENETLGLAVAAVVVVDDVAGVLARLSCWLAVAGY